MEMNCSMFQKQERITKKIINKINSEKKPDGKIRYADELLKEINLLFSCTRYTKEDIECNVCHIIATLRKETAELLNETKKILAEKRFAGNDSKRL